MTIFSAWLNNRTKRIGGIDGLVRLMPEYRPQDIAAWFTGLRSPGYRAQIHLSEVLQEPLSTVRSHLGQPHNEFSELIARAILRHGDFTGFSLKSGINKSRLDKWLAEGNLPNNANHGEQSQDLQMIARALIMWGDTTPHNVLMADLAAAVERSTAAKQTKVGSKKNCNSSRIAS